MIIKKINRKHLIIGLLLLIILPVIVISALSQTNLFSRASRGVPVAAIKENPPKPFVEEKERGLVWAGIKANENARCNNAFEIVDKDGNFLGCTHGPDPAPVGVDVTEDRDTQELVEAADSYGPAYVPCVGDGASGQRIQMIYAVSSDKVDRYNDLLSTFNTWAGMMDQSLNDSASKTGGEKHFKFVTNSDCTLNVLKIILTPAGDDNFSATVGELQAMGHTRLDRKYLMWSDATLYCGVAQFRTDDKPTQDNLNNARGGYGRIDAGCWGRNDHLSEVHELMHTLGAVQHTAPHGTQAGHCSDEWDVMCYRDATEVIITQDCNPSATYDRILDCNNDDYFNTNPAPGSYLDTHWNTANSVYLSSEAIFPSVNSQAADKIEAENGFPKYPAQVGNDSTSSMLKYIQF